MLILNNYWTFLNKVIVEQGYNFSYLIQYIKIELGLKKQQQNSAKVENNLGELNLGGDPRVPLICMKPAHYLMACSMTIKKLH